MAEGQDIVYREAAPADADAVGALILRCLDAFNRDDFTESGEQALRSFVTPAALRDRMAGPSAMGSAFSGKRLIGIVSFHENTHLTLLFVDAAFHRRGVARALFEQGLADCIAKDSTLAQVTVNATSYARPAYIQLGFTAAGEREERNGVRYYPMVYEIAPKGARARRTREGDGD